nr:inner membrane CreD family protein [uncultured Muribaculum sp.]
MGMMCCVLMFGVLAIWIMSYSRESSNKEVAESIVKQWGKGVYIQGLTAKENLDSTEWVRPAKFDCQAEVETQSLHRSIYEAEVFTANVSMSESFDRDSLRALGDTVVLELRVTTKQIVKLNPLKICEKEIPWCKSDYYLFAKINLDELPERIEFSTAFEVRGSEALFIKPIGENSTVTINGEASNPSYNGYSLPIERSHRGSRFSAKWEDSVSDGITYTDGLGFVGTNFLVGVDRYQKVERSMKYSFIIIILTFISVLFVEIMRKQPIPLLNYFLIGAALIIFYSLLLSFVELIPFGFAYLIASTMTVVLITGYIWKMLQSRKLGISIGGVLSLMYIFCYIMLSISTYALLFGSLLLFFSLAAMMYASLNLKKN